MAFFFKDMSQLTFVSWLLQIQQHLAGDKTLKKTLQSCYNIKNMHYDLNTQYTQLYTGANQSCIQ